MTVKLSDLLRRNIVWFALGMMVTGVGGTLAFLNFIDGRIQAGIESAVRNGTIPSSTMSESPIPSGLVVAIADARYSDQNKGDEVREGCPAGWIRFKEAENRFIIGANARSSNDGPEKYWVSRQAGAKEVKLRIEHLPSHNHDFDGVPASRGVWGSGIPAKEVSMGNSADNAGQFKPYGTISLTGGGQAHNNIPPYIALYFCKKV